MHIQVDRDERLPFIRKPILKFLAALMAVADSILRVPSPSWDLYPRWVKRGLLGIRLVRLRPMMGAAAMSLMMEQMHVAKGVDPVADAFAGANVRSDIYAMRDYQSVVFLIYDGVGATGSSTILVNSCDDASGTTRTPMKYYSREIVATDVQGAITERGVAGYVNTVGSSKIILIEACAADLTPGDAFVEIEFDESVDNPVLGGVCALFFGGRYKEDVSTTVLA